MFARKTSQNRRLYRYPTQPNPQSLLDITNVLNEVTNTYEFVSNQKRSQEIKMPTNVQCNINQNQKENQAQHCTNPSVVIKNISQNYKSMIEVMEQYCEVNSSSCHSHSHSNGSTVSHIRSASDADSVIYLGPEDSGRTISSSKKKKSRESSWDVIQVQRPHYGSNDLLVENPLPKESYDKNQGNINEFHYKGDDTFNLSQSNEINPTIPTLLSESKNISIESIKNIKSQINSMQPTQQATGDTYESEVSQMEITNLKDDLYLYCSLCKCLRKADSYKSRRDNKFKSGMLNFIVEMVCCVNSNSAFQRKTVFRCSHCKQAISRVDSSFM